MQCNQTINSYQLVTRCDSEENENILQKLRLLNSIYFYKLNQTTDYGSSNDFIRKWTASVKSRYSNINNVFELERIFWKWNDQNIIATNQCGSTSDKLWVETISSHHIGKQGKLVDGIHLHECRICNGTRPPHISFPHLRSIVSVRSLPKSAIVHWPGEQWLGI